MRYFEFEDLRPVVIGILICVLLFGSVYPFSRIYKTAKAAEMEAQEEVQEEPVKIVLPKVEQKPREPLPVRTVPHVSSMVTGTGTAAQQAAAAQQESAAQQTSGPSQSDNGTVSEIYTSQRASRGTAVPRVVMSSPDEMRGVWFSFYDWYRLPHTNEATFRNGVKTVMENVKAMNLNTIIVHVHSHSDSCYPSAFFPMSRYAAGKMGGSLSYDPLAIMIEEAHAQGIALHAWLNPYRITSSTTTSADGVTWDEIPEDSVMKKWWNDPAKHRNILVHEGKYYLNPSKTEVQDYLADAVYELVSNYSVDGVHFDDYFYPTVNDNDPARCFDLEDYRASGSTLSVADWRRENVSSLVRKVYAAVKDANPVVPFGISPAGNLNNLRSNSMYFTDIDRWLSEDGYVDYIAPQIYWGFEHKNANGTPSQAAFDTCLSRWISVPRRSGVAFYGGLSLYRAGVDYADGNAVSEWLRYDDIMKRQVELLRKTEGADGFILFDYRDLLTNTASAEVENLREILY